MSTLTTDVLPHIRTAKAVEGTDLAALSGEELVAISSVMFPELTGYDGVRFQACLEATEAYRDAGIPQLVLFDQRSHYQVPMELARHGAIVVAAPRSGLAMPYLDAARLMQLYAGPKANVLKAEGDKLLTVESIHTIEAALRGYDVVVGGRTVQSMESMSPIQQRTEAAIDAFFGRVLGLPHGISCGVQAYTPKGLGTFLSYEDLLDSLGNNWMYLAYTPAVAQQTHLPVGGVMLDLMYNASMVEAESSPEVTLKRLEQLLLMEEGGYEILDLVYGDQSGYQRPSDKRLRAASAMLADLRKVAS